MRLVVAVVVGVVADVLVVVLFGLEHCLQPDFLVAVRRAHVAVLTRAPTPGARGAG